MTNGRVLVSAAGGIYVLKLTGDVRVTMCAVVDDFIKQMFADDGFRSVIVDLSETDAIDSTSLGLLARLSIEAGSRLGHPPTLVSPNPDITRILTTMGLDDVFDLSAEPPGSLSGATLGELAPCPADSDDVRERVIAAHRTLMELNEHNRTAFRELVATLEGGP